MKRTNLFAPIFLLLCSSFVIAQQRAVTFYFGDGSGPNATFAQDINNNAQVAGYVGGEPLTARGFIWQNGQFQTLFQVAPSNQQQDTKAFGINDAGDTVGTLTVESGVTSAFLRTSNGNVTTLNLVQDEFVPIPQGINNAGTIVGYYDDTSTSTTYGFVRSPEETYTTLSYPGSSSTFATGINAKRAITGYYVDVSTSETVGFVYRNGHFNKTFQCTIDGEAQPTKPQDINRWGVIVGSCGDQNFVRLRSGAIRLIDLSVLGSNIGMPILTGINDQGDIAGSFNPGFPVVFGRFSFVIYNAVK